MEWIISGLVGLLACWCAYSVVDHFSDHHWWTVYAEFKRISLLNKLLYITYQIVKWTGIVMVFVLFFIMITIFTKLVIFG